MANVTLIFCGGGNRHFAEIAIKAGFLYGSRLPCTTYFPVYFSDLDFKKPDRKTYMDALAKEKPYLASVLDWEKPEQLSEVLDWAKEASEYVTEIMIIPKVHNGIQILPREINGKLIRLGYSIPTKYGGTSVMISEFYGWPVHLLGGSPLAQIEIWRYLPNVLSADGNMAMKMATTFCAYFEPRYKGRKHAPWPTIIDVDGKRWEGDGAHYEAFRRSCQNIMKLWKGIK